jgi:Na+/H+ antiporter NhaD/arsenite permease-like protein
MQIAHASTLLTISLASILSMLQRPRRIAEAFWACAGAILLILTRLIPLSQAMHGVGTIGRPLFWAGMMILAEVPRGGVFATIRWLIALRREKVQITALEVFQKRCDRHAPRADCQPAVLVELNLRFERAGI